MAVHVYLRSIVDAPQIEPDILVDVLRCWFVFGAPVVSPVRRSCFIDVGRIVQVAVDKGRGEIEVVVVEEGGKSSPWNSCGKASGCVVR